MVRKMLLFVFKHANPTRSIIIIIAAINMFLACHLFGNNSFNPNLCNMLFFFKHLTAILEDVSHCHI